MLNLVIGQGVALQCHMLCACAGAETNLRRVLHHDTKKRFVPDLSCLHCKPCHACTAEPCTSPEQMRILAGTGRAPSLTEFWRGVTLSEPQEVPLAHIDNTDPAGSARHSKTTQPQHRLSARYGVCSTLSQSLQESATSPTDARPWGGPETYAARTGGVSHKPCSSFPRSVKTSGL